MAKKKVVAKPARHGSLSVQDRFFIEQHGDMPLEELASTLDRPIEVVQEYLMWLAQQEANKPKVKPAQQLMGRPAKGVIAMTEAASMAGDEKYLKYVTVEAINQAIQDNKPELVTELKARMAQQERDNQKLLKNKYSDKIHYIIPIDEDDKDAKVF